MLRVRCKQCGVELTSTSKTQVCGCHNQMELIEGKITASDLSQVVIVKLRVDDRDPKSYFSEADFEWKKKRSKRKIKKLDFDVK